MYQGIVCSVIEEPFVNVIFDVDKDETQYLHSLRNFIIVAREKIFSKELTELWSAIDDILASIDSALYKLSVFKEPAVQTFESFCYERFEKCQENDDYNDDEE